ncbi:MAG TPA: RHS repeat-associated core domain-containing protein [Clostridia bacterium]|nr:RHS repeat-associated core domain-containing protein [Clostridia bacterium]
MNLPSTVTYTYDGNGNLTSDGSRTFEYDFENQLTNVYVSGQWRSEFAYDAMMRRRVRREYTWSGGAWVKTNEVRYVYDGRLVIQERDANNLSLVTYTRGKDLSGGFEGAGGIGGLLARTDNQLTGVNAHAYYHFDGNGNVVSMINTNGTVVARYSYDPFGNILAKRGPLADVNLYRFSSKEYHPNSGLVYYLYRYYEPNLQRWVNRDPIGERGGVNLYAFAVNSPILAIDPYGLLCAGPELAAPALLSGESLAVGAATGASAGTAAIALAGAGPAPILVWALMNSVQAPTVYPDPLYTGVQNAVPVKVVCTLPDKSGKLRHRSDPGSKDDYTDAWEECSQRYRDYYNAEVWAQGTDNPEMECFDDFMDTCLEGLNFANDGPP